MFKPFYIHENTGPGKLSGRNPRGFTLKVQPDLINPRNVVVSGAWCSHKDEFNKKIGRATADRAEQKSINKRKLPSLCASMAEVHGGRVSPHESDYFYLLKFVV